MIRFDVPKPHIRKVRSGWTCLGMSSQTFGETAQQAWCRWIACVILGTFDEFNTRMEVDLLVEHLNAGVKMGFTS